jgi:hypothetical protein
MATSKEDSEERKQNKLRYPDGSANAQAFENS